MSSHKTKTLNTEQNQLRRQQ